MRMSAKIHQTFALASSFVNRSIRCNARPSLTCAHAGCAANVTCSCGGTHPAERRRSAADGRKPKERALQRQAGVEVHVVGQVRAGLFQCSETGDGHRQVLAAVPRRGRGSSGRRGRRRRRSPRGRAARAPAASSTRSTWSRSARLARRANRVSIRRIGAAVRVLGLALLVEERRQLLVELGRESLAVVGGRGRHELGRPQGARRALVGGGERLASRPSRNASPSGAVAIRRARPRLPPLSRAASAARISSTPFGAQLRDHERLRQRREGHHVAAARDRVGQLVGARRRQDEHRVGRRLLEHLQQGVGGRGREPVGLADQEDLAAGLGGGPGGRAARPRRERCRRGCRGPRARRRTRSGGGRPARAGSRGSRRSRRRGTGAPRRTRGPRGTCPIPPGPAKTYAWWGRTAAPRRNATATSCPSTLIEHRHRVPAYRRPPTRPFAQACGGRTRDRRGPARSPRAPRRPPWPDSRAPSITTNRSGCSSAMRRYASVTFAKNAPPSASIRSGSLVAPCVPELGLHVEQDHEVGEQPLGRPHVQREHVGLAEPPRPPLVGEGRVDVPVADDDLALGERRVGSRSSRSARAPRRTAAPRHGRRGGRSPGPGGARGCARPVAVPPGSRVTTTSVPRSARNRSASATWVPLPAPSTPSKAMNSPVAGGRLSFGTIASGRGRDRRYRASERQVMKPAPRQHRRGEPEGERGCPTGRTAARRRRTRRRTTPSAPAPSTWASAGNRASDRNRTARESVVSAANVRPRNSSATFSCSSV